MLIKCQDTSWLVYIRRPFRLYMMPLMAGNKADRTSRCQVNTISLLSLLILKQNQYKTAMKDHGLHWNMSFSFNSWLIILLRVFLCNLWWFFSKYQLFDSSKAMNSSVNSLESVNSLAKVPSRHTNRGPIKPEWISRSYETAQKSLFSSLSSRNMHFPLPTVPNEQAYVVVLVSNTL